MKLWVKGSMLNIVGAMLHRLALPRRRKMIFWQDLKGLTESLSKQETIVLGADLNIHVGEGNIGDEEVMGRCDAETRKKERLMVVDCVVLDGVDNPPNP